MQLQHPEPTPPAPHEVPPYPVPDDDLVPPAPVTEPPGDQPDAPAPMQAQTGC